jgi:predicted amidophosphoribosyltransferase
MTDERTQNPGLGQRTMEQMEYQGQQMAQAQMQQANTVGAVICPQCGAVNEQGSSYCISCGAQFSSGLCPNCNSPIDADADFCEVCHHYIRQDVCSFCGAQISPQDAFCPECGSPRGGIVCPTCRTLNDFAFCKQCGTPLTDEAKLMLKQMKKMPEYQELVQLAREYDELMMERPIANEKERVREKTNNEFRDRVLRLLAQDEGVAQPIIPEVETKRMTKEEVREKKEEKLARISELLSNMQAPPNVSPAYVRNFAMAQKPSGVRLAWQCNWKHAMHSSPCGCAKPQMGGKWVVLGRGSKQEIKDDN